MRTPKLTRSIKLKGNARPDRSDDSQDSTFKTSIDELKSKPSRQSLRQHFTGAFPETKVRPSLELEETIAELDMRGRGRSSRTSSDVKTSHDPMVISSPSSTSVSSGDVKKLPTVRESNSKIDIGEVINLLQELRMTASPAELVALHKALLPTRDSVMYSPGLPPPVEENSPAVPPSPFVRRRSMLPPGVATRKASVEPLKSPEEAAAKLNKARPHTQPASRTELAALDLADDTSRATIVRALTPMEHDTIHMGAYRHGTLRVTNGAASPEPSFVRRYTEPRYKTSEEYKVREEFETAPSTPSRETIPTFNGKGEQIGDTVADDSSRGQLTGSDKLRRASEPARSHIPVHERELCQPVIREPTSFEDKPAPHNPVRKGLGSCARYSRDLSQSDSPLGFDDVQAKQHSGTTSQQGLDAVSRRSSEPARHCIDDGKAFPNITNTLQPNELPNKADMPRFAQRWSHRLSHISHEPGAESQLPSSPYEDNAALRSLSKRLSTVTDRTDKGREAAEAAALETPAAALAKLNGETDHETAKQIKDDAPTDSSNSPISVEQSLPDKSKRPQTEQSDSGYGSDASHFPMERKAAREAGKVEKLADVTEQTHRAYEGLLIDDDEVSLYSFHQVLKSPYLLSGLATPSPPGARGSKKHLSLLGLNEDYRASSSRPQSPNNPELAKVLTHSAPLELKTLKPEKKLQKPMPISVRKKTNAEANKKEDRSSKDRIPLSLYDDLEDTFPRQSGAKSAISLVSRASRYHDPTKVESNMSVETRSDDRPPQTCHVASHDTSSKKITSIPVPDRARFGDVSRETRTKPEGTVPASIGAKIPYLNGLLTKTFGEGVQSTPVIPTSSHDRPGDSTESIADAVKRAVQARRSQDTGQSMDVRNSNGSHLSGVRKSKSKKLRKLQSRDCDTLTMENFGEHSGAGCPTSFCCSNDEKSTSEQQTKEWREQRGSIRQTFDQRNEDSGHEGTLKLPVSAVPGPLERSTGGNNEQSTADSQSSNFAKLNAETYRDLIGDEEKQTSASGGGEWRDNPVVTVEKCDDCSAHEARIDSAYSVKSYHSAGFQIDRARSPGGRVITPSGNFHPYKPADGEQIESSHSEGLAGLARSVSTSSTTSFHRPTDTLDSFIDRYNGGFNLKRQSASTRMM